MFTRLLNKTAEIKRKAITQNAIGEPIEAWATVETRPVRYAMTAKRVSDGSYKTTVQDYLFFFESSAQIILADRIYVDGLTFNVKSVGLYDDDTVAHHVEVVAELIENS